ncbi:MAG: hypothetical protein ACPL2N_00985 [Candidatus Cryosericum sp.]
MTLSSRISRRMARRNEFLGMLTEIAFTCGLIGLGFLVSWLFFLGR